MSGKDLSRRNDKHGNMKLECFEKHSYLFAEASMICARILSRLKDESKQILQKPAGSDTSYRPWIIQVDPLNDVCMTANGQLAAKEKQASVEMAGQTESCLLPLHIPHHRVIWLPIHDRETPNHHHHRVRIYFRSQQVCCI